MCNTHLITIPVFTAAAGAQSISDRTDYNNLEIADSDHKTMTCNLTTSGVLDISVRTLT